MCEVLFDCIVGRKVRARYIYIYIYIGGLVDATNSMLSGFEHLWSSMNL